MVQLLVIDDNQKNLFSLKELILSAFTGVTVLSALNGEEGLEVARTKDPDVILLDIVMPGMDGFEVCRALKTTDRLQDIPVIILTAERGDKESKIRALELGADAFLAKPVEQTELVAQIRSMLKLRMAIVDLRKEKEKLESLVRERTSDLIHELVERKKADELLRIKSGLQIEFISLLSELITDNQFFSNTLEQNLRNIIVKSAHVIKCERTSIWSYEEDYSKVKCIGLYTLSSDSYGSGEVLLTSEFPEYTESHKAGKVVVNPDTRIDPRTAKIQSDYLRKNDIRSLLDAPIWSEGKLVAILSFESTGSCRDWYPEEQQLAQTLTTAISFFFELDRRNQTEREMEIARQRLADIIEGTNAGTWECNFQSKEILCNKRSCEIIGYDPDELNSSRNETWYNVIHPDDLVSGLELLGKLIRGETSYFESELRMQHKNGEWIWTLARGKIISRTPVGKPLLMTGVLQDITERKLTDKIQLVQNHILNAVVDSKNLETLLVLIRQEISSLVDSKNFFVAFYLPETDTFRKALLNGEEREHIEWKAGNSMSGQVLKKRTSLLLKKQDLVRYYRENQWPIADKIAECWLGVPLFVDEEVKGVLVLESYNDPNAYDIKTASLIELIAHEIGIFISRKQDEESLLHAKEKAEESDRLKSAFLANMSHEIRTPMNSIVGFSQLLTDPELTPADRERFTSIISTRSDDLLRIVSDILEISRLESGSVNVIKSPVSLNQTMQVIEAETRRKLERFNKSNLLLESERPLQDSESILFTDLYILKQTFINLLDNAIKFTTEGRIRIGYRVPESGKITFFVSDTGIGIRSQNQKLIFEHFMKADLDNPQQYCGTGVGLAICKGSLALLGGEIWVESSPGKGSTFFFTLPFESPPEQDLQIENPFHTDTNPGKSFVEYKWPGKRLLLVEDESNNMNFLKIVLNKTRAELVCVENGQELRNLYQELDQFDLVLLDVRLPDANGWELAAEIKAIRPQLPVIAQTAFALPSDRKKGEMAGCDDYIAKPIDKDELIRILAIYLNR